MRQPVRIEGDVRSVVQSRALLSDRGFFSLWLAQGIAQTAQNALLFTLLVVILRITGSSIHTSLLILCFILPSIPLGFAVGVLLDRVDKGPVLVTTNLVRAACCLGFFFFHDNEWVIYGIAMVIATASLFFNPAVVSLIPQIVPRERLVPANSLYNFTLTASQLVGIVFISPTLLKTIGTDGTFIAIAVFFGIAALLGARVARMNRRTPVGPPQQAATFATIPTEFRESWRALSADRKSLLALSQLIVSSTLVLLFAILIPRYMEEVLSVPADNAALVFAPTGIGALVGLRFIPVVARGDKNRAVVVGLAGIAVCMVLLALVHPIADVWESGPDKVDPSRLLRVSLLQALVMCFAGPMGFFYALLNAPAQTILHERAPPDMRGRIFATQVVSANFISLVPLLLVGAVTDLLKTTAMLIILAALIGAMAMVSKVVGKEADSDRAREREPQAVS